MRTIEEFKSLRLRESGLIPTMGAFHEGHLSLMRAASDENEAVVVSIFVNPTQFGPQDDFDSYPREEERDLRLAEETGVTVAFVPNMAEIYPRSPATLIEVPEIGDAWEGAARPGHFAGVATIVNKLFNIVSPKRAYFGLKDYQQCCVIKRMVADLNIPVQLKFHETVRERDGLAMSSRNGYLTREQRVTAPLLYAHLIELAQVLAKQKQVVARSIAETVTRLEQAGFLVDYLALVDADSLKPLDEAVSGSRLIAAARLGTTRLIDNVPIT